MGALPIMFALLAFARYLWLSTKKAAPDQLVRSLSERCIGEVTCRLKADLSTMSAAELRGYVRARALAVLRQQARLLEAETGRSPLPAEVTLRALERTVHLVIRQLMTTQPALVAVRAVG
jgi:hypothetical protein